VVAIFISGLQAPFCFYYGDHYLSVSDIGPLDWAPPKM